MKRTLALVLMVFGVVGCTPEYKENGFSNHQTYEAAMQGGFLSEKDYRKANKYNYTSKKEWDEVIALSKDKGYHSLDEYFLMSKTNSSTTILKCSPADEIWPSPLILHINQDNFDVIIDAKIIYKGGDNRDNYESKGEIVIEQFLDVFFEDDIEKIVMPNEDGYSPIVKDTIWKTPIAYKNSNEYYFNIMPDRGLYNYHYFEIGRKSLVMTIKRKFGEYRKSHEEERFCKKLSLEDYLKTRTEHANSAIEYFDYIQQRNQDRKEQFKNSSKEF